MRLKTNLGVGSCLSINILFFYVHICIQKCLMSNRIVLKANKMMIMVLLNVSEGQILVGVCLRFIDV